MLAQMSTRPAPALLGQDPQGASGEGASSETWPTGIVDSRMQVALLLSLLVERVADAWQSGETIAAWL